MKNSQISRAVLITSCALTLSATACDDSEDNREPDALSAGLQRVLDSAVAQKDELLPGAITRYRRGQRAAWSGSAGTADMQAAAPIKVSDRVRAGSILKTFLSTVTLQHVEDGRLRLDQPITQLLPAAVTERIANADRISLRMLLNHTSGIPEWITDDVDAQVAAEPARVWTTDEALEIVSHLPAWFEPGAAYRYSNTNYTLVGLVLDELGEGSWRDQVRERVLVPLNLKATSLPASGTSDLTRGFARGYQEVAGEALDVSQVDSSMAGAAGGHALLTSVGDLGRFIEALLAGRLFEHADTLDEMTTMIDAPDETGFPHRYGLGIESYIMPSGAEVIGHGGMTAGYATMMFRIPDSDASLVTSVNTGNLFTNALQVFIPSVDVIVSGTEP